MKYSPRSTEALQVFFASSMCSQLVKTRYYGLWLNENYEINDLYGMFKIMKALNISSKGLKPLEELKTQVITALNQSQTKPKWAAGQVSILLNLYG